NIFNRLGLKFRAVRADTGAIGGDNSHEFHVLADSGEDALAYSNGSDYAANVELAEALSPAETRSEPKEQLKKVSTPGKKTIVELSDFLNVPKEKILKPIAVIGANDQLYLLLLRGDHELNETKLQKIPYLNPFRFATEEEI